jgi:PAS domain S-box-containing protein
MLDAADIYKSKLLIVDDQVANVQLLEQLLGAAGYTGVSSTMLPQDVCALHQKHDFDLILLDLKMPVMDGFQVMQALKAQPHGRFPSVIVLTAEPGHKLRALQAGAKDFISKPFDLVEVKTRIYNLLEMRLLYKQLENYNKVLERAVLERTRELLESETRFRGLINLATDWYWEQDETGSFSTVFGPVFEMTGLRKTTFWDETSDDSLIGWNAQARQALQAKIEARQSFIDFTFGRVNADGSEQQFRVSGEPILGIAGRFKGYRGIGAEITRVG